MSSFERNNNKVPAPFLKKTYDLVDDPATDDVVSWNQSGTTFVVFKTAEFATHLLPNYFKHSNFSSFIRQLNTYGFRKIVADKWEFANENFRRGQQELLAQMRRRKPVPLTPPSSGGKISTTAANPTSLLVNSGDEQGSSSTSSPNSKSPGSVETAQFANLSGENEKLRKDNQMLSLELSQMKKQCDELITFLTKYVNVGPDQINYIMSKGIPGSSFGGSGVVGENRNMNDDKKLENNIDGDDDENEDGECLKLFGVLMKEKKKKRSGDEAINNHIHKQTKLNILIQ